MSGAVHTPGRCTMGVGCDEYGVCYAEAHGQPDQCPRSIAVAPDLATEGEKALTVIDDLIFALTFERVDHKHPNTIGRAKEVAASLLAAIAKARGGAA